MHCRDCFYSVVCGSSSPYNDVTMCKQFTERSNVLSGPALQVVLEDYERLKTSNREYEREIRSLELENHELRHELELLRIIKQTLEMQSGMKFDI